MKTRRGGDIQAAVHDLLGRRPAPPVSFPQTLSHYRLANVIGSGSSGTVYRAHDDRLQRVVAIKTLRPHPDFASIERFKREAQSAASLNNPHIAAVYDLDRDRGTDFIVMEYVPGRTLDRVLLKRGPPLKTCLHYAWQMVEALDAIHSVKLMHRDVKPQNFKVTPAEAVKMLDFGLARIVGRPPCRAFDRSSSVIRTCEGTILGTPGYMSPEQVRGQMADQRSDIFCYGAILYEMLTGRQAFREETSVETMNSVLKKTPPKLGARVPAQVAEIVYCCLEKEPRRRYKSGEHLKAALARVL